jgi:hypothetical protein
MSMDNNRVIPNKAAYQYAEMWADELREQLRKDGKDASGRLMQSVRPDILVTLDEMKISLTAESYLKYVDEGISGTDRKFDTPYAYTTKPPPIRAMQQWISVRGIQPRPGMTKAALPFAMQRSIWKFGIKPTNVIPKTAAAMGKNTRAISLLEVAIAANLENELITELNLDQING